MPEPLHHTTLAAITRLAQTHGLPIVRADKERVIVGEFIVSRSTNGRWFARKCGERQLLCRGDTPLHALRAAIRESA